MRFVFQSQPTGPNFAARRRRTAVWAIVLALGFSLVETSTTSAQAPPAPLVTGLINPESVAIGGDGQIYASEMGERDKQGDGRILVILGGKARPFTTGLNDPRGLAAFRDELIVSDHNRVMRIDRNGKASVLADAKAFPKAPMFLNDIAVDQVGNVYVTESGDRKGSGGAVYRISTSGKVTEVLDAAAHKILMPNGVLVESDAAILVADFLAGKLYRLTLENSKLDLVASDLGTPDGIVRDPAGNLFLSDNKGGRVCRIAPGSSTPEWIYTGFQAAADCCLSSSGRELVLPDLKLGSVTVLPVSPQPAYAPLAKGLKNPESVVQGPDGRFYISEIGEFGVSGDGKVVAFVPGKGVTEFAAGLDDPKGITVSRGKLYVTDNTRVVEIAPNGQTKVLAEAKAFPHPPLFLNDIVADEQGALYVSDSGDLMGSGGAVFRIAPDGKVTTVTEGKKNPDIQTPNGLLTDGPAHLLVVDFKTGVLSRLSLADGTTKKVAEGFAGADGLTRDLDGHIYVSCWLTGKVFVLPTGSATPRLYTTQFASAADSCLEMRNGHLLIPDMKAGTLTALPLFTDIADGVDETPLAVGIEPAYPELQIRRPIIVTHAGDGKNRVYIASQYGQVYLIPNDQNVEDAKLFFDLSNRVSYKDNQNEEGFLGMAFHPKFRENGQFFVYYTTNTTPLTSIVSRFKVSPDNPDFASPESEEELMRIAQPFWNHNGGTLAFGPDGHLYIALGDGGKADDPLANGQNLKTVLGSILRIDIDRKDEGKPYAIPKDNPFLNVPGARPEAWAYGVRNIWRMSFDRQTGACWAADVGQNVWEEINIVEKGDNLGWNPRESRHKFQPQGSGPKAEYKEPIWEYHHDIGKSITGGFVYRGKQIPELYGAYVYADYVTGRVWGLFYDAEKKRVVANRPIFGNISPVMSFGEDEQGELTFTTPNGPMYRFTRRHAN